ncbi:MAG: hypothetical protein NZ920_05955 [Aigarchaeota archaeon]|nr:hypothetical protein [Aigarchaeota archaeon]MDW8092650.1 hypothetical protein [Nitrososphaerota archaeon]
MVTGGSEESPTFVVKISPFIFDMSILEKEVLILIIPYLNLAAKLTLLLTSLMMLVGSFMVKKRWSRYLVSTRGATFPIVFLVGLFLGSFVASSYIGFSIPIVGEFTVNFTIPYGEGLITVITPSKASLTGMFWIAVAVGLSSLLGKLIHNRSLR